MSFSQVVHPNVNIPCRPGWCLAYVQSAFKAGWSGTTATDAWNNAKFRHLDDRFPNGVAVPVWFAISGEPAGHVVIRMPDGSVYSTSHPTNLTPYHHPSMTHLYNYYGGRLTLRGWSEDIGPTRVIQLEEQEMPITQDQENVLSILASGSYPGPKYPYFFRGKEATQEVLDQFVNYWFKFSKNDGLIAQNAVLKQQVADLTSKLASVPESGIDQAAVDKAIKEAQEALDAAKALSR